MHSGLSYAKGKTAMILFELFNLVFAGFNDPGQVEIHFNDIGMDFSQQKGRYFIPNGSDFL
ncbi:hypothetical protein [Flavihumibacter profundi]|uniref:hypothetical protein n=1 Tax=Flavihumibacter profundi TaxID=2716883 RepID=UPI001CC6F6FC|nr:hypothetical protein [Flavihumibacter profundi]MBZ5856799.1 hypothetical protein [Flavihumibacter profundi]